METQTGETEMKVAACLNEAGVAHVAARLGEIGLDWSVDGTANEIAGREGFMALQPGQTYDYEISNLDAGVKGYGVLAYIEIDADKHVTFEDVA